MKHLLQSVAGFIAGLIGDRKFLVFAPPPRVGPKPEGGKGAARAAARLSARQQWNAQNIPDSEVVSRPQRRAMARADAKAHMQADKQMAFKVRRADLYRQAREKAEAARARLAKAA